MQKVFLVAVNVHPAKIRQTEHSLNELDALAKTRQFDVVGRFIQSRYSPDSRTYIGKGKLEEIKAQLEQHGVDLILFDHDLSPKQGQALEEALDCMVWDRTQLILEIFARHARTSESMVQVELARLQYMLPRLKGMWAHLDRERGGISASRGMGEKQINVDRTIIRNRIRKLQTALKKIACERNTQKKRRSSCFQVGIVGYTNAGKSSLMNLLIGSCLTVEDQLFATLDSCTRILKGVTKPEILLSDTVGFIRNLPHQLVASFRSTLDVLREADLLLHVADVSHAAMQQHIETALEVLDGIGAADVPRLLVLNKADLLSDETAGIILEKKYPQSVLVSAFAPESRELLISRIKQCFQGQFFSRTVKLPYSKSDRLADLYANSIVGEVAYEEDAMYVNCTISHNNKKRLAELI